MKRKQLTPSPYPLPLFIGEGGKGVRVAEKYPLKFLRLLQADLPLVSRPFDSIARKAGMTPAQVVARIRSLKKTGAIRRFGVVIHHRKTGYAFNGMVAVNADDASIKRLVARLLNAPAVTHAYERTAYPDWPYRLYFMIHAKTKKENTVAIERLFKGVPVIEKRVLYSTREFKKVSYRL